MAWGIFGHRHDMGVVAFQTFEEQRAQWEAEYRAYQRGGASQAPPPPPPPAPANPSVGVRQYVEADTPGIEYRECRTCGFRDTFTVYARRARTPAERWAADGTRPMTLDKSD